LVMTNCGWFASAWSATAGRWVPCVLLLLAIVVTSAQTTTPVTVRVDVSQEVGTLPPVWAFFGYDEPNYTYMKDGRKLLSQLAALSPVPVYIRAHNLLTSGDGTPSLKWGSTNAYTEGPDGRARYDWTIVDRIFDTYVERGMRPLVEIGFMPEALTSGPPPYRHSFSLEKTSDIFTAWAYPPKDYSRWAELVYQWVRHTMERYGRREVENWLWEVWNEPNIGYWKGTPEQYHELYDHSVDAVKRALPSARVGGPHSTGPGNAKAREFLRTFLEHCARGRNYATGKTGAPLDFIAFHAKGRPEVVDGHVRMGISNQLTDIDQGFATVASFPEWKQTPIVIGESDPEGCAACSARVYKQNGYRNGTMYSSYTAASFPRKYELARRHGVRLLGIVTWAFEFENQPWFDGFRDLATNGIEKPVLNVFRMFGMMSNRQIAAESSGAVSVDDMVGSGVRSSPDVGAVATRTNGGATVLLWHYHDDDVAGPPASVDVAVNGLPASSTRALVRRYCIDENYSNSYAAWRRMGSPAAVSESQNATLEREAALATCGAPEWRAVASGTATVGLVLPRQAVSLIEISWQEASR
jgi:xylan 1,4-beta-xylosidase